MLLFIRYLLGIGIIVLTLGTLSSTLRGHEWMDSWCCSDVDCKPVPCHEIEERDYNSYYWNGMRFKQVKPSQDSKCYACINSGEPRCLYIQHNV